MSRHSRAQATPTHASVFQLFTVAMTGHADEWVQLPEHKVAVDSLLSECNKREQERESGIISEWIRGFACLVDQQGRHCSSDRYSGTVSGAGPIEKEWCRQSIHKHMQQNDAWTWHEDVMLFELMQLVFKMNEVHLNQGFKCNSKLSSYICHLYVFTYTACISWFVMHETGTDGKIAFFW